MLLPTAVKPNIVRSLDAQLDAFRGGVLLAQQICSQGKLEEIAISKGPYEECGHHYLKEHTYGNVLYGLGASEGAKRQRTA